MPLNRVLPFICLLVLTCLFGVNQADDSNKLCLWKIDHEGSRVYLLGSVHLMKEDMYPLPYPITAAFNESDVVVFEIDLTEMDEIEIANLMEQQGIYTPPATISDDLSPETLELLNDYLEEEGIKLDQVSQMKPWMLSLYISIMDLEQLGFKTELGLDQHLNQKAMDQDKETDGLETAAQQISFLSGEHMEIQDLSLRAYLSERHQVQEETGKMISAWRSGDADGLYELAIDQILEYPELQNQMDRLILERNLNMVQKIRGYLDTQRKFMVVAGALHMGGPEGIIQLLSEDFTVEQISY
ncbi:MAG: TraB/GumN family protein [Gammaproteobacteria bacterium]|nr:TraB/GumN family protein [Gammaproteobacteria bacterium]